MEQAEVERLLMKPTARRRLGKYVLLGRLGHGGMGKIYLAYLPGPAGIEKLLVIKRLHSHLTGDEVLVSSFLDEARLSMALNHPNIVHTYDVGEVDGRYFMVMEHIDGQNLGVLLRTAKRSGHYPDSDTWAGLFMQVLEGLHAAHVAVDARGRPLNIIHRDISPQNVLITYDGTPKLVDFGIAKAAMRINETDAGVLKGKYAYMSPEQCEGHELDPRSDVFSAGIVLWEMLAGRRLYKSDSVLRSVERILHEAPISPVKVNADCDPALAEVVLKALQKKPEHRFASAEEFRDALEEALRARGAHFRKAGVRELMHQCFEDVMLRQREVLDRCLAGDIPVEDPSDSESGHSRGKKGFGGDSRSDLKDLPHISIDLEPTTPSSLKPSPLITGEGESKMSGVSIPIPPGTAQATRSERPTPAVVPDAATAAYSSPLSPAKRRSRAPLAAALLLFIVAGAAAALFVTGKLDPVLASLGVVGTDDDPPAEGGQSEGGNQEDTSAAAGSEDRAGSTTAQRGVDERAEGASDAREGAGQGEREDRGAQAGDDDQEQVAAEDDDDAEVEPDRRRERREDRRRGRRSRSRAAAQKREQERAAAARVERERERELARRARERKEREAAARAEGEKAERTAEEKERAVEPTRERAAPGRLTLQTNPWAEVYLGGKKLGDTPLVNVEMPAGDVVLTLRNPEEGIEQKYFVRIRSGKTTVKKLGLR